MSHSESLSETQLELESLRAIYGDELVIREMTDQDEFRHELEISIRSALDPSLETSPELSLHLTVKLPHAYGQEETERADVSLSRVRGLCDHSVDCMRVQLQSLLQANADAPVLFDVLQLAQSLLDDHDSLHLECAVCLCSFERAQAAHIADTECGHFFHNECLAKSLIYQRDTHADEMAGLSEQDRARRQQQLKAVFTCPTCRTRIDDSAARRCIQQQQQQPHTPATPVSPGISLHALDLSAWRERQAQLRSLYDKQQAQGGIIDLDAQKLKWRVDEQTVFERPQAETEATPAEDVADACAESSSAAGCSVVDQPPTSTTSQSHHHRGRGYHKRGRYASNNHYNRHHYGGHRNNHNRYNRTEMEDPSANSGVASEEMMHTPAMENQSRGRGSHRHRQHHRGYGDKNNQYRNQIRPSKDQVQDNSASQTVDGNSEVVDPRESTTETPVPVESPGRGRGGNDFSRGGRSRPPRVSHRGRGGRGRAGGQQGQAQSKPGNPAATQSSSDQPIAAGHSDDRA